MKDTKRKRKPWIRTRHRVVRWILNVLLSPYARLVYGMKLERFREQGNRQYLILYNHQTAFDQFFVGMIFKGAVYYLATEDLFSNGALSSLIRYLVAPIPIKKQSTDVAAVMNCLRVCREGGTIAIAPEGNRTYSGKTEHISFAIAPLARKLSLPIAFVRIEGGFGVHPRFSDKVRRGCMQARVSTVLEPEEYAQMDDRTLYERICRELYVNEANSDASFHSRHLAEYMERALYICPSCGPAVLHSRGDILRCTACGCEVRYLPSKELCGVNTELPFRYINDWYEYQSRYILSLPEDAYIDRPMYENTVALSEVIVNKKKKLLRASCSIRLYGDRIVIDEGTADELCLPHERVRATAVLGRNKLNIYHEKTIYQCKGDKRFCAVVFVHMHHRTKHIERDDTYEQFLGL